MRSLIGRAAVVAAAAALLGPAAGVASASGVPVLRSSQSRTVDAVASGAAGHARAAVTETPLPGPHVFGWGYDAPDGVSSDGTHVWVANFGSNAVIELSATTGKLVKVLSGASYGFNGPGAVSSDGTHVWVVKGNSGTVTEMSAATGALVKVLSAPSYGFREPVAVFSDGTNVWVTNYYVQSVTGFPA